MNKKRITAFLLTLVMLVTSLSVTFAENAEETVPASETPVELLDTDEFRALYAMGFLGEEMATTAKDAYITRAQFTGYLFKLAGYSLTEYKAGDIPFLDVSIVTPYYNEICTMYAMGIVNGTDPDMFSPDAHVTYAQACKLIIDVLGYRNFAEIKYGEYPEGYVMMAGELEINDGVKNVKWDTELTAENAVTMLYNAGLAEVLVFSGVDKKGNPTYETDGTDLFEKGNNIYKSEGVMESNGIASIVEADAQDGITVIDGVKYVSADVDLTDLLGIKVDYFYRDDETSKKLLWATPDTHISNVLDIEAEDLIITSPQYTLTNIVYYDSKGKEESAQLKRMVDVIYNNSFCAVPTLDLMKIETGKMRLIDNNDDEIYDTVVIEEYKNIFINAVIPDTNIIADKYNYTLKLDSYDTAKIIKDGKEVGITDIGKGELISYVENIEKTKIFIYAPDSQFTGTVKSVSKVRSRDVYNFGDESYRLSNTYKALMNAAEFVTITPKVGNEYTFWLDMGGEIAEIEETDGNMQYALLMSVREGEPYEEEKVYTRLLMPNDTKITGAIKDKVIINGQRENASEVIARSKDENDQFKVQVVKVAFKEDGTLRQIDFAADNTDREANPYGYDTKQFTLDLEGSKAVVSDGFVRIDGRYMVDGNTVVFSKLSFDESEPYIARSKSEMSHDTYNVQVYDADETMAVGAVYREGKGLQSAIFGSYNADGLMLVESIEYVYDEENDQEVKQITGYISGQKRTARERTPGAIKNSIGKGDIVRLFHYNNQITDSTVVLTKAQLMSGTPRLVSSAFSGENALVFAKLYVAGNSGITILTPDDPAFDSYGEIMSFGYRSGGGEVPVTIYDIETDEITLGDFHDLYQIYSPDENGDLPAEDDLTMVLARVRYAQGLTEAIVIRY